MKVPCWPGRPFSCGLFSVRILWFRVVLTLALVGVIARVPLPATPSKISQEAPSSEDFYKRGKALYERFQFREAAEMFERALALDSDNSKAYYLRRMARILSGDDSVDSGCHWYPEVGNRETRLKQEIEELERPYDQSRRLRESGDFDRALKSLEQILERLKWSRALAGELGDWEARARKELILTRAAEREREIEEAN